ncbi:MAG: tyrosine-type recombinase/integrase, partial [Rhodoferax sp.]|nr:tyrosine-type recombinase/integrase [Rhodoferax sp.]
PMKCDSATIWYRDTFRGARHQAAIDVLEKRKGDHPTHVFTYEGNPIVQVSTKAWRNALQRAGIHDFRWHDLRHTFATWHREAGTPTHELQRLGGWKTQSMVERYAHVAPEGLQFAASRLDSFMHGCGCTQTTILVESEAKRPI